MEINPLAGIGQAALSRGSQPVSTNISQAVVSADAGIKPSTATAVASVVDMNNAVDSINKQLQPIVGNIQFSVDQDSGNTLIKIVDKQTQIVLLQIPSKQALEIAKQLGKLQGLLIKEKA